MKAYILYTARSADILIFRDGSDGSSFGPLLSAIHRGKHSVVNHEDGTDNFATNKRENSHNEKMHSTMTRRTANCADTKFSSACFQYERDVAQSMLKLKSHIRNRSRNQFQTEVAHSD